jgi:hypothetical protein
MRTVMAKAGVSKKLDRRAAEPDVVDEAAERREG